jgi:ABC-type branched-subunit amino acid transport system substrate-binding protein
VLRAAHGWSNKGLDALFIPDAAPTAIALGAEVRGEIPQVVLLGTESWNDAKALSAAGTAVDGALFADAFSPESQRASTRAFVEQYRRQVGTTPTAFEAQAFDAGMLVRKVMALGARTREEIAAQLTTLGAFEAAGLLRSSGAGIERVLSLLRCRDGKVEEVLVGDSIES